MDEHVVNFNVLGWKGLTITESYTTIMLAPMWT